MDGKRRLAGMDSRRRLVNIMRKEFGNLKGAPRIKIVTIVSVNLILRTAVIKFAEPDIAVGDPPDQQTVKWLDGYWPFDGDLAYLLLTEGAPVLIGSVLPNSVSKLVQDNIVGFTLTAGNGTSTPSTATGTVVFPRAYGAGVVPTVQLTVQIGSNFDVYPNLQTVTNSQFTFRVATARVSSSTTSGSLHWTARG